MLLLLNMTNLSNAPGIIAASPSRADPTFRAIDASTPANVLTAANGPAAANSLFSDRLWQFTTELTQANAHTFASTSRAASRSVTYVILSLMLSNTSIIETKFLLSLCTVIFSCKTSPHSHWKATLCLRLSWLRQIVHSEDDSLPSSAMPWFWHF